MPVRVDQPGHQKPSFSVQHEGVAARVDRDGLLRYFFDQAVLDQNISSDGGLVRSVEDLDVVYQDARIHGFYV